MLIDYMDTSDRQADDWRLKVVDENESWFVDGITNTLEFAQLSSVEIETINRCNNDCSFCPVNRNSDIRKPEIMEDSLFYKIINELKEKKYSGYISLFSNNEPLLDKRIYDWIDYARKELPNATAALYTNGLLLDVDGYLRLTNSLDYLVIDNYNDEMELNPNIKKIVESGICEKDLCKTRVVIRKKNQVLQNRGGLSPNKRGNYRFKSSCILPFCQMIIRPNGDVSRCCQDAFGNYTLGNVKDQSLYDVWNGDLFGDLRTLIRSGRGNIPFCNRCDQFGMNNYFPSSWDELYFRFLVKWVRKKQEEGRSIVLYDGNNTSFMYEAMRISGVIVDKMCVFGNSHLSKNEAYVLPLYDYEWIKHAMSESFFAVKDFIIYDSMKYPFNHLKNRVGSEYYSLREKLETKKGKLVIFGAGIRARQLIQAYDLKPCKIIDNSNKKIGSIFMGYDVEPATKLTKKGVGNSLILDATGSYAEILNQLKRQGISGDQVIDGNRLL